MNKTGFERLRSVAAAGAMGMGCLVGGVGSVRAATIGTSVHFTINSIYHSYGFYTTDIYLAGANVDAFGLYYASMPSLNFTTTSGYIHSDLSYAGYSYLTVAIDGTGYSEPDSTIDYTGTTYTAAAADFNASGLDVELQYHFFTTRQAIRLMVSVTNITGSPITSDIAIGGGYTNSGAKGSSTVAGSQSGNTDFENSDMWYVVHNGVDGAGVAPRYAVKTLGRYGDNPSVTPTNEMAYPLANPTSYDTHTDIYTVTVSPGDTARILFFYEMSTNITDALANAPDYEGLSSLDAAGLLTGISAAQQAEIVNYGSAGSTPVAASLPHAWLAYLSLPLVGLFGLRRRQKKLGKA